MRGASDRARGASALAIWGERYALRLDRLLKLPGWRACSLTPLTPTSTTYTSINNDGVTKGPKTFTASEATRAPNCGANAEPVLVAILRPQNSLTSGKNIARQHSAQDRAHRHERVSMRRTTGAVCAAALAAAAAVWLLRRRRRVRHTAAQPHHVVVRRVRHCVPYEATSTHVVKDRHAGVPASAMLQANLGADAAFWSGEIAAGRVILPRGRAAGSVDPSLSSGVGFSTTERNAGATESVILSVSFASGASMLTVSSFFCCCNNARRAAATSVFGKHTRRPFRQLSRSVSRSQASIAH